MASFVLVVLGLAVECKTGPGGYVLAMLHCRGRRRGLTGVYELVVG